MNEQETRQALAKIVKDPRQIDIHIQRIRSEGKGYFVPPFAKKYVDKLRESLL